MDVFVRALFLAAAISSFSVASGVVLSSTGRVKPDGRDFSSFEIPDSAQSITFAVVRAVQSGSLTDDATLYLAFDTPPTEAKHMFRTVFREQAVVSIRPGEGRILHALLRGHLPENSFKAFGTGQTQPFWFYSASVRIAACPDGFAGTACDVPLHPFAISLRAVPGAPASAATAALSRVNASVHAALVDGAGVAFAVGVPPADALRATVTVLSVEGTNPPATLRVFLAHRRSAVLSTDMPDATATVSQNSSATLSRAAPPRGDYVLTVLPGASGQTLRGRVVVAVDVSADVCPPGRASTIGAPACAAQITPATRRALHQGDSSTLSFSATVPEQPAIVSFHVPRSLARLPPTVRLICADAATQRGVAVVLRRGAPATALNASDLVLLPSAATSEPGLRSSFWYPSPVGDGDWFASLTPATNAALGSTHAHDSAVSPRFAAARRTVADASLSSAPPDPLPPAAEPRATAEAHSVSTFPVPVIGDEAIAGFATLPGLRERSRLATAGVACALEVLLAPCSRGSCDPEHGRCEAAPAADFVAGTCRCAYRFGGAACDIPELTWREYIGQILFLTLSNAAMAPAIVIAARQRLVGEAAVFTSSMVASTIYHLCDVGYSCPLEFATLQLADYLFAFGSIMVVALHFSARAPREQHYKYGVAIVLFGWAAVATMAESFAVVAGAGGAISLGAVLLDIAAQVGVEGGVPPWRPTYWRQVVHFACRARNFRWLAILAGAAMLTAAAVLTASATPSSYWIVHSVWHLLSMGSAAAFLIGRRPLKRYTFPSDPDRSRVRTDAGSESDSDDMSATAVPVAVRPTGRDDRHGQSSSAAGQPGPNADTPPATSYTAMPAR